MQDERRKNPRYIDVGRVDAPDICVFPGVLCDISASGCRIKFPAGVALEEEGEYELKLTSTSEKGLEAFTVKGQPVRILYEGKNGTEVAFSLLVDQGATRKLNCYIEYLASRAEDDEDYTRLIIDSSCRFV